MKQQSQKRMSWVFLAALAFACCCAMAASWCAAQTPGSSSPPQTPSSPSGSAKTPNDQKPKNSQDANPFPEDTNTVPVLPSANSTGTPAPDSTDYGSSIPLPGQDGDPVKSPDDAAPSTDDSGSSSSSAGLDNLLKPPPDTGKSSKNRKADEDDGMSHDSPKEDESVGSYYLEQKNWKAALSRFESALVLDPENPDVYWGLAEAQRHIGDYISAKANYLKVMEYDPDSKHGKEAKRILREPEVANAKAVSSNAGPAQTQQQ
ncbi:MAG TPA: tetratricopeptide repeat protein [Terracidiphilus sp.]|jgi:tetratricopeptide (TPR) repeat protein|nr:tetratricopeptide repeat protein [Terracidiphilus sp.]